MGSRKTTRVSRDVFAAVHRTLEVRKLIASKGSNIDLATPTFERKRNTVQDAEMTLNLLSTSVTPAAAEHAKIQEFIDLASEYEGWMSGDDNLKVRCDYYGLDMLFRSAEEFRVTMWITVTESATAFVAQSEDASSGIIWRNMVVAGFAAANTELKATPIGDIKSRIGPQDAASNDHYAEFRVNLAPVIAKYLEFCEQSVFTSDPLPEVKLLVGVISNTVQNTVTIRGYKHTHTYTVNRM